MRAPALFAVLTLAVLALSTCPVAAQFPTSMNYQVMLTDDFDEPLSDQAVSLVFRVYTEEVGGVAVWTESQNATTNSIGVVSLVLGSVNPFPVDTWPALTWLEVEVDSEVLSPRRKLTSSPYAFQAMNSRRLGGLSMSEYATDEELSTPGTINSSSNPVDWTRLKNVPYDFADGTDDVGGSGDGHSLDASDGDPVDAVWVADDGEVGIGTTDPESTLHLHSAAASLTGIRLTTSDGGSGPLDGFVMYTNPLGGGSGLTNHDGTPIYIGTGGAAGLTIRPDSSVDIGNGVSQPGELSIYGSTSYLVPLHRSYENADGGRFELADEAENLAVLFGADDSGIGGRLQISRNDTYDENEGIDLNGCWGYSEEPAVRIMGSARSAMFNMENVGSTSVVLPQDAIYGYEILDEPGVASSTGTAAMGLIGLTTIAGRTISVPASGYVMVLGSCQLETYHETGTTTDGYIGVSDTESGFPANQDLRFEILSSTPTGWFNHPITCHGLFEVASAGTYTYYMLAEEISGSFAASEMQLTLMYLPTAYGEVTPTLQPDAPPASDERGANRGGLTQAELASERAEAEAFNLARIERELAELQAQVEAMKEER
ncbi:MAG TPA: hypothetical protein VE960_05190 [bacterium]|nr:hypothetical protein [bacterium]